MEASTEASMDLAAHGSPSGSGSGRSGDPTGTPMPLPMATPMPTPMPTHQSSSRHPPSCLSHLLHRPRGITVTIQRATTRMSASAQGDGDRWRPRRHRQRLLTPTCAHGRLSRGRLPLQGQPDSPRHDGLSTRAECTRSRWLLCLCPTSTRSHHGTCTPRRCLATKSSVRGHAAVAAASR